MLAVVHLDQVVKSYGGLRPLRLQHLEVQAAEVVALAGFDQATAEVFANLVTGATLPEEGTVAIFGRPTADIVDSDDWLATVDRFGIVSERVVLLDQLTPLQNIAMALTLEIEPLAADVRAIAERFAAEAGLTAAQWNGPLAGTSVATRHRVRLARALAGSPAVLLLEHPTAGVEPGDIASLAKNVRQAAAARGLAVIVLASEPRHAEMFASRLLKLHPGTGQLTELGTGFFRRVFG